MTKLYIIEGPNTGDSYDLKPGDTYIGRASGNDVEIKDRAISSRHLKLVRRGEQFFIEDLKSTNGTYVNGVLVHPGRELEIKEGYPIAIGNSLICLDREFTVGGTMVHNTIKFRNRTFEKRVPLLYKDRPLTNPKTLQLLYKVSHALMESFDLNQILQKLMDYLFDCLGRIHRGAILLLDSQTGELSEVIARTREGNDRASIHYSRTIVDRVLQDGKAVIMSDTSHEKDADLSDSIKALKIRSIMCVPLISRGEIRGAIYVDSLDVPNGFRKEDLYLLTGLSSPAAVAIENALLYANMEKLVESRTRSFRQTEKRLRKSEGRFRAIFDNMQSGVAVYEAMDNGADFVIVDLNRAAEVVEKIGHAQVLGKRVHEIFRGYEKLGLMEIFRKVWKSGQAEHVPECFYEDDRVSGWREYHVYRLPSGEIVTIYNDITNQKKAEEEQRSLQRKLLNAQKLESVGRLAGGVAHNFRNILQAILGNVEYLEMIHGEQPEVGEAAKNINNSVNKGVDLVDSLLHFSRQGEEFEPMALDMGDVVRETYKIIDRLFDREIATKLDLQEGLFIRGNKSLLSQVFMNLFTNARDAMPGGGELLVRAVKRGDEVVVTVSDTGCGMDKKTIERIFDPFFTAKEVGKGTGLGLSTVHGIMEEHKGSVAVSSTLGKGTTFTLTFPLADPGLIQPFEKERELIYGRGQKVMIVDDEESALEALTGLTRTLGYDVYPVEEGVRAVEHYLKWRPDVVIMDRSMPGMGGISCIKEIMKYDEQAKVVIISGYEESGPDGIDASIRSLIKGYITKPCGMEELSKTLSQVLNGGDQ